MTDGLVNQFLAAEAMGRVRFISEGSNRRVYVVDGLPGVVFKRTARITHNGNQNTREFAFWTNVKPELREHLAPTLDYCPRADVLAMARTERDYDVPNTGGWCAELVNLGFRDAHSSNVGRLNGRWVMHDYGIEDHERMPPQWVNFECWAQAYSCLC